MRNPAPIEHGQALLDRGTRYPGHPSAVGIAFGALGAAAGSSARIELELMGQAVELNIGEIAGGMAGTAIGDATSAVYDDANGF